jgi:hypothetical protein
MLAPIFFILAFLAALTGALLEASAHAASADFQAAVARTSDVAIVDGVADFSAGLALFVQAHGSSGPWPKLPSWSARKPACATAAQNCRFAYRIRAVITAASSPGSASTGSDAAGNLQASAIDEQRVSAIVTATVFGETGEPLASHSRFLTYRVFGAAPYAVVTGARDIAAVNGTGAAAQGDSGGSASTPAPKLAAPGTEVADDTRIHVRLSCQTAIAGVIPFTNDQQPAGNDSLPWGDAPLGAYEAPCASPDAAADTFRSERWTNGDANASGWTQ